MPQQASARIRAIRDQGPCENIARQDGGRSRSLGSGRFVLASSGMVIVDMPAFYHADDVMLASVITNRR